jgi:hypothetical protein
LEGAVSLDKWGKANRDVHRATGWAKADVRDFLKYVGLDKVVGIIATCDPSEYSDRYLEWTEVVRVSVAAKELRRAEMREVSRIANCRHNARKNREIAKDRLASGTIEIYRRAP